jgi:hypothetical protein
LIFCVLVVALTLPLESVLLQAVSTATPTEAAIQWAAGLSADSLDRAGDQIRAYPFIYRRAIMRALSPERRSQVWRANINDYIQSHPDLNAGTVAVLQAAADLASPENLSNPTAEARVRVKLIGDQVQALIGQEEAQTVLYRLGPRDGTFASLEPTRLRLANWVRAKFIAMARFTRDCDCSVDWGCDGFFTYCKANTGCQIDDEWPMCGWLWDWVCDGLCAGIFVG